MIGKKGKKREIKRGRNMRNRKLKRGYEEQPTCLCLYRSRQATMWVDMIAEDLLAAVRYKGDIMSNR